MRYLLIGLLFIILAIYGIIFIGIKIIIDIIKGHIK